MEAENISAPKKKKKLSHCHQKSRNDYPKIEPRCPQTEAGH